MPKVFDQANIIECVIDEDELMAFLLRQDINDAGEKYFPFNDLAQIIMDVLPEYAFADYEQPIEPHLYMKKVREAARCMYDTSTYKAINKFYIEKDATFKKEAETARAIGRGEFGEILLHLLLRDFKSTIPLVSKLYFKDSRGVPAHGFDAVHISPDDTILWLGESKLYTGVKSGLKDLIEDLKHHLTKDFLSNEYTIIKKNLTVNNIPNRDYWIERLSKNTRLEDMITQVNIPMLCVYNDTKKFEKCINEAIEDIVPIFEPSFRELKQYFDDNNDAPLKNKLNIILFLFPVLDKEKFVLELHKRLYHLQQI